MLSSCSRLSFLRHTSIALLFNCRHHGFYHHHDENKNQQRKTQTKKTSPQKMEFEQQCCQPCLSMSDHAKQAQRAEELRSQVCPKCSLPMEAAPAPPGTFCRRYYRCNRAAKENGGCDFFELIIDNAAFQRPRPCKGGKGAHVLHPSESEPTKKMVCIFPECGYSESRNHY